MSLLLVFPVLQLRVSFPASLWCTRSVLQSLFFCFRPSLCPTRYISSSLPSTLETLPAALVLAAGLGPLALRLFKAFALLCPSFLGGSSQAGLGLGHALPGVDPEDLQNILTCWSKGHLRLQVRGAQEALPWAGLLWPGLHPPIL